MNNRQKIAIESCLEELTDALLAEVFHSHLLTRKIFSRNEIQIVRNSCKTDEEAILVTLNKLKHKSDAWDCLIGFLKDNRYGQLVAKLISFATEDNSDDSESDESTKAECGSGPPLVNNSSSSTFKFPNVAEWLNGCEPTISPTSESFDDNLENLDTGSVINANIPGAKLEKQLESVKNVVDVEVRFDLSTIRAESTEVDKSNSLALRNTTSLKTIVDADDISQSISDLNDRHAKSSPSELLPDVIKLMTNQVEKVSMQMSCQRLIDQYSSNQLRRLESSLRRSLIEVLLSVVKLHCHDNLVVRRFCDLLVKISVTQGEIDWYQGSIDFLLGIICDHNNLVARSRKSTLKLLMTIAEESDVNKRSWILQTSFVENICKSITMQLDKSEYEDILEVSWTSLIQICSYSMAIKKTFLDAGGISLFQQCYKKFNKQAELVYNMTTLMLILSNEESIRPQLMANGNLEVLWAIRLEQKGVRVGSNCFRIFSNFLQTPTNWPLRHPTIKEVKKNLGQRK